MRIRWDYTHSPTRIQATDLETGNLVIIQREGPIEWLRELALRMLEEENQIGNSRS